MRLGFLRALHHFALQIEMERTELTEFSIWTTERLLSSLHGISTNLVVMFYPFRKSYECSTSLSISEWPQTPRHISMMVAIFNMADICRGRRILNQMWRATPANFTHICQFTSQQEYYSVSENRGIMSSVALEELFQVWENNPDDIIRVILFGFGALPIWGTKSRDISASILTILF